MKALARVVAAILVSLALTCSVCAFKEHDFKKCDSSAFCKRTRGQTGPKYTIDPKSLSVKGATVTATLSDTVFGATLNLTLRSYGGTVRLVVDELPSKGRYHIPDILEPGIEALATPWSSSEASTASWTGTAGSTKVKLGFDPFKLEVEVDGTPALVLNSRSLFSFEHRRTKKDGDPEGWWEESFNGHADSKPKGPEAISLDVVFPGAAHVYGIPEHATNLALKPTKGSGITSEPYRLYNLDVFEYNDHSPFGLYGSIPVMLANKAGLTAGIFWHNAAEMYVDVEALKAGTGVQWISESGALDLFILPGPSPAAVLQQYALLTGTTAMPQMFAIGYHQCRWNYKDDADARAVDAGFDEHAIPYDVLWLDIEHTNGKRYLTWESHLFPDPIKLQDDVASRGRKMVTIVDPHVKRDTDYYIHQEAQKLGYYVRNKDGHEYDGWCWPGASSYLDVTSPAVRDWWALQFTPDKYKGSTQHLYIWNDMNEPSVFNGPEITMQKDNLHHGNIEHRDIHNVFGYYYHLATANGLIHRGKQLNGADGDRPFVLSRAFFSGTQRVGPIWTGDNAAQWSHLKVSVPMLLTLGLTGLPFSGADVGGFFGNPDAELLTRWYQLGAYSPFFRGHAHLETLRREPWLFGEDTTRRVREAVRERYSLLPYLYTLFRHANLTGAPIMRPLWYEFPAAPELFAIEQEFLLGPGLLVAPVVAPGTSHVDVTLPKGSAWYDSITGKAVEQRSWLPGRDQQVVRVNVDIEGIPSFYRGGHIVPRRSRPRRSTATMAKDPFTLIVALDQSGTARGDLYLDDGHSFAFLRGQYAHREFTFKDGVLSNSAAAVHSNTPPGTMPSDLVIERIVILGLPKEGAAKYSAKSGSSAFDTEWGAADVAALAGDSALVVRRPNLPAVGDWSLEIKPAAA